MGGRTDLVASSLPMCEKPLQGTVKGWDVLLYSASPLLPTSVVPSAALPGNKMHTLLARRRKELLTPFGPAP